MAALPSSASVECSKDLFCTPRFGEAAADEVSIPGGGGTTTFFMGSAVLLVYTREKAGTVGLSEVQCGRNGNRRNQ